MPKSRTYKFTSPPPAIKNLERRINKQLEARYPGFGPVQLFIDENGGIAYFISLKIAPGKKALLDEVYNFIGSAIGERRGRRPGEKKVQVKLRLAERVRDKVKEVADKQHSTLSDVIELCLKERYG